MQGSCWLPLVFLAIVPPGGALAAPGPAAHAFPHRVAGPGGTVVRDSLRRIDGNQVNMWVTNLGSFAWDVATGNAGLIWPKGTDQRAVFASGLWLGGKVNGELRVALAEYSPEYGPGGMVGGTFDDPSRPQHRVYKMARWTGSPADSGHVMRSPSELAADPNLDPLAHHSWSEYLTGAAPYGAPTHLYLLPLTTTPDPGDSVEVLGPDVVGDQMLWAVFNDADPGLHTNGTGGTGPLGIEVQQTMFAFDRPENLRNTVFLHFRLINKGMNTLDSVFVSLWSDPDLGGFTDDYVGCDTSRALGFCYNALASDMTYGAPPPAVGYVLLRGLAHPSTGAPLGLTAFSKYIGGTDPSSPQTVYHYMQGLLPDGSALIDPTTGQATRYFLPGDPVTGQGWLDSHPADRRMMLSSGPSRMAPGDTQVVVAAITVGRGGDNLSSVGVVRCQTDIARALYLRGFASPGLTSAVACSTNAGYATTGCPRAPSFWSAECAFGGALLPAAQLTQVATGVDSLSTLFDWAPGEELAEFCAVMDPPGPADLRQQARREYAAFMANYSAGLLRLRTTTDEPVSLNPGTSVACPILNARTIGQLASPAVLAQQFLEASYLDNVADHGRALAGVAMGLPSFDGGAGPAIGFPASALDPVVDADSFVTVEIPFDRVTTQVAYRYLRLERQSDGTAPPQGRAYLYGGPRVVRFTCWDVVNNVQLEVGFVERAVTDDAGTLLDRSFQPATFDSTWRPDTSSSGGHEYLIVFRRPYGGPPKPELAQDGVPASGAAPALYTLAARLRRAFAVIDDGDAFQFLWGRPATPSADSLLVDLESLALDDPAVQAAYRGLIDCLAPINAGIGIGAACTGTTPEAITFAGIDADSMRVVVTWLSAVTPLTASVERRFEGGGWAAVGQVGVGPEGLLVFADTDVVAGGRYDYRLAVDTGGRVQYFGLVQVDVPGRSRFGLFGAQPNPATADLVISFSLASRAPARLELLDIAGRRVLSQDLVGVGPGPHLLNLGDSGRFRAGIYLVRITQEGRRITGKYAIVH